VDDTFDEDWARVFANEKLFIKNVAGLFYEVNPQGRVRCSHNSIPAINRQFRMGLHPIRHIPHARRMTALFLWFVLPHDPEDMGRAIDRIFDRHLRQILAGTSQAGLERSPLPVMQLNYKGLIELAAARIAGLYYPLSRQSQRKKSCLNATRLLIALKRFHTLCGRWPDGLDELDVPAGILIDPLNSGSFVYRPTAGHFVLYSKGANGRDDDGRYDLMGKNDDLPIWPERRRVTGRDL